MIHVIDPVLRTRMLPTLGKGAMITMMTIKVVIHMAVEIARAVEPGACANENTAAKPLGTIVPIGSTIIWWIVIITIRTYRSYADTYANLGLNVRCTCNATQPSNSS
jgi:hypothetical protein